MAFTYTTRKDGRLVKKVTVNGKPIYLYSDDPKDLERQYIEVKHNSYNGIVDDKSLLKNFAEKWLHLNSTGKEVRTVEEYESLINSYIIPKLGNKKIKEIKKNDVKELLKEMEHIPTTSKKTLQLVKRILNDAVDNDIVVKNCHLLVWQSTFVLEIHLDKLRHFIDLALVHR